MFVRTRFRIMTKNKIHNSLGLTKLLLRVPFGWGCVASISWLLPCPWGPSNRLSKNRKVKRIELKGKTVCVSIFKKSKPTVGPLKFYPHCKINKELLLRREASVVFHPVPWYPSSEGAIDWKRHSLDPLISWQLAKLAALLSFISALLSGTSQHTTLGTGRDN